jgi:Mrp family chromosome partitioning ATPase
MTFANAAQSAPGDRSNSEVQLLRAYVERALPARSVILVTSATGGDGKSLTAYALADCLARSGRRTALVDATSETSHFVRLANAERSESDGELALYVPLPKPKIPLFREATSRFIENMRSAHEFTIVDGATLLKSEMAMAFAEAVDGVLLSVRLGRPPSGDDELTLLMLERSAGRVLGIVAASTEAIEAYERRGAPSTPGAEPTGVKRGVSFSWSGLLRHGLDDLLGTFARTLGGGLNASPAGAADSGRAAPTLEYGTVRSARP